MAGIKSEDWPPIQLTMRQAIAAFWSICWPAGTVSVLISSGAMSAMSNERIEEDRPWIAIGGFLVFLVAQAVVVPRLVTKNYSGFRVEAIREGDGGSRKLVGREKAQLMLQVIWPQLFLPVMTLLVPSGLNFLIEVLVVGPIAVQLALRRSYSGFHLQAFGVRYI